MQGAEQLSSKLRLTAMGEVGFKVGLTASDDSVDSEIAGGASQVSATSISSSMLALSEVLQETQKLKIKTTRAR